MDGRQTYPYYFRLRAGQLFGCYHASPVTPARDWGVVLSYPVGREYIRFHRSFRELANLLAQEGFLALRFDYYGCGDSAGDFEEARVSQWVRDIGTAIDRVKMDGGISRICLIGLRLGAALAATVGAGRTDVDALVLWDPVIEGRVYVEQLVTLHRDMLRYAHVDPRQWPGLPGVREILGFPFGESLIEDLDSLDLLAIQRRPARDVLLVSTREHNKRAALDSRLTSLGASVALRQIPSPQLWVWIEDFGQVLVSRRVLQCIVNWVCERCT